MCRGADCGSDHYLVRSKVLFTYTKQKIYTQETETRQKENQETKYNLKGLLDPSIRFLYMLRLSSKLNTKTNISIEEKYKHLKECIHAAAKEALGEEERKRHKSYWWDEEAEHIIKEKEELYKRWLRTGDREDRNTYARVNREVKKIVKRKKNEMWERKCEEMNRYMGGTRMTEAWRFIKNIRKDSNEKVRITAITIDEWEQYYNKLLNEDRAQYKEIHFEVIENKGRDVEEVTVEEIQDALKSTKNGRAGGPGGIPIELVKNGPIQLLEILRDIFDACMRRNATVPTEWRQGIISSIYKKGNKNRCENYRGVTVTSSIGRLYGRLLARRIEKEIQIPEEQSGFTTGRSCTDNIFILRQLIEKKIMRGREAHLVFVDVTKAYDNVPLSVLFKILEEKVPPQYANAIKNLYKDNTSRVKEGVYLSQEFPTNKGLRQGCSVSPTLFKIYLSKALEHWNRKCGQMGISIDEYKLSNLLFADDQVIIAEDHDDISYMLRNLDVEYRKWGLDISYDKTKYMVAGGDKEEQNIHTEKGDIQTTNNFKYLGTTITKDGKSDTDIKTKTVQGRKIINKLNSIWWSNEITKNTKKKIYSTIVEPITTYGCEVWEVSKRNENRLRALQMDWARRSCRVSRIEHITNEEIKRKINMSSTIIDVVEGKRLMWYGHLRRMNSNRWPSRIWEWVPKERRKKGRPRNTWMKGVVETMTNRQIEEGTWENRGEWRRGCRTQRQL